MISTLAELDQHVKMSETIVGEDVFISPLEWCTLAPYISPFSMVHATEDRPPMFWFNARRIRPYIPEPQEGAPHGQQAHG